MRQYPRSAGWTKYREKENDFEKLKIEKSEIEETLKSKISKLEEELKSRQDKRYAPKISVVTKIFGRSSLHNYVILIFVIRIKQRRVNGLISKKS